MCIVVPGYSNFAVKPKTEITARMTIRDVTVKPVDQCPAQTTNASNVFSWKIAKTKWVVNPFFTAILEKMQTLENRSL